MLLRLLQRLFGRRSSEHLVSRHERRREAKRRHHETGAPLWTQADRHPNPGGTRQVEDVTPGTPGHFGSVRSVDNER
jgi:hypothetical protein